jgi:hypothetical protein
MPATSLVNEELVQKAVSIWIRAPALTVREVMLAAGFSSEDAATKYIQRKVARSLPGKAKKTSFREDVMQPPRTPLAAVTFPSSNGSSDVSELTDPSGMHLLNKSYDIDITRNID